MGLERCTFFLKVHLSFILCPKIAGFLAFFFEKIAKNKYICNPINANNTK